MLLCDLLYTYNCALISNSEEDAQSIVDDFTRAAVCYGLTISIKKTLSRPGTPLSKQSSFLGGTISHNAKIDDKVVAPISKASVSYGRLQHHLWMERGVWLNTKIQEYQSSFYPHLYCPHLNKVQQFHMRCLRKFPTTATSQGWSPSL